MNKSNNLLHDEMMKKPVMAKFGLFITLAFVSILTGCETNPQTEQAKPVSDAPTEQAKPVSDAPTEQAKPVSEVPTEQAKPVSEVPAEQAKPVSDPPDCEDGCQKLATDTSFSQSSIQPEVFANLPQWNNICEKTNQDTYCTILKPYQFSDGIVYLKISSTESFITDIHFTSAINQDKAMSIAKAALNSQLPFEKTEKTQDQIKLYSGLFEQGDDAYYLEETHLKLNAQNQVTQITSYSTTP